MRAAILDFGTNTFNLLIAEKEGKSFKRLYYGKQPVKLGKGGINKGMITGEAMERGYKAIANHMETISGYGNIEIHAYATSAIRNARNGKAFVDEVKKRFGFDIHVISGDEEAALIYKGVAHSVDLKGRRALIVDIGGGSNECIICDDKTIFWKQSFELGMARILEKFNISDPIKNVEINAIEDYFYDELKPLFEKADQYQPEIMVGASGSFDTIASLSRHRFSLEDAGQPSRLITAAHFKEIYRLLLDSKAEERSIMPGMEQVRVEMIVPASIFINFVYTSCGLTAMYQSDYALKEGVMSVLTAS